MLRPTQDPNKTASTNERSGSNTTFDAYFKAKRKPIRGGEVASNDMKMIYISAEENVRT